MLDRFPILPVILHSVVNRRDTHPTQELFERGPRLAGDGSRLARRDDALLEEVDSQGSAYVLSHGTVAQA